MHDPGTARVLVGFAIDALGVVRDFNRVVAAGRLAAANCDQTLRAQASRGPGPAEPESVRTVRRDCTRAVGRAGKTEFPQRHAFGLDPIVQTIEVRLEKLIKQLATLAV